GAKQPEHVAADWRGEESCQVILSHETSRDRRYVMQSTQSRRRFLATLSSAGVAGVIGVPNSFAQEAPPETTILRLPKFSTTICGAPVYIAEELLRAEGFTDIRYVPTDTGTTGAQLAARG